MNKLIFNDFLTRIKHNKKNILVIGDAMLDQYYFGSIDRISPEAPVPIFNVKDIENKSHMYFVHSYEFIPKDKSVIVATTDYSSNIVCAVEKENIFGTQFHPEKSDKIGLKIIDNFINL